MATAMPRPSSRTNQNSNSIIQLGLFCCLLFVSGGATCARRETIQEFMPPPRFDTTPTLAELTDLVNRSLALERLESNTLIISSDEISTKLRGNLKWERPHNFHLEAYLGSRLMGVALAAGSNKDMFWLQQSSPPTLYYASHNEFNSQAGPRSILPVSPLWLREALGVVEFDPALQHDEPIERADGKVEVRSYIPTARGPYRRHVVLDPKFATVHQTLLYNDQNKLVAVAQQSEHQYYSAIDYSLPHKIEIQLQPDQGPPLAFSVEVGFYLINQVAANQTDAFTLPDKTGITAVNLVQINSGGAAAASTPPTYTQAPFNQSRNILENYPLR